MAVDDADETMREEDEEENRVQDPPVAAAAVPLPQIASSTTTTAAAAAADAVAGLAITVGGNVAKEALCLLDGIQEDDGNARVILLIKRLPATLGRTHDTTDKNFVGMGSSAKAVSRQHVRIDYRVPTSTGGCGHIQSKVGFRSEFFYNADDPVNASDIVQTFSTANRTTQKQLPETGFYSMTCLGKNRVLVNGKRLEQGQTAMLQSGCAIRIATFCLYFFAPSTSSEKTLQIRDDVAPIPKKRKLSLGVSSAVPAVAGSGTGEGIAVGKPTLQAEIEEMSTPELLRAMKLAVDENVWDRRHQLVGSTISYRAVLAAARDPGLAKLAERADGQLSRTEIMDWVAACPTYTTWVEHMLSKMEAKSYQASITKGLLRAGFKRTALTGRYIKWLLPDVSSWSPTGSRESGSPAQTDDADSENARKEADGSDKSEQHSSSDEQDDNAGKETPDEKEQYDSDDEVADRSGSDAGPAPSSEPGKMLNEEKSAVDDDDSDDGDSL